MGATVRAFDVRPVTKQQVESMKATFIELDYEESGESSGGYAKEMSPEWHKAAQNMFRKRIKRSRYYHYNRTHSQ